MTSIFEVEAPFRLCDEEQNPLCELGGYAWSEKRELWSHFLRHAARTTPSADTQAAVEYVDLRLAGVAQIAKRRIHRHMRGVPNFSSADRTSATVVLVDGSCRIDLGTVFVENIDF